MENNQKNSITIQVPTADEIASKRPFAWISFAVAIGLFFFTFCDIQCTTGQKIASVSGLQLVMGTSIGSPGGGFFEGNTSKQKVSPNIWAILALASAVGGCAAYLMQHQREALIGVATGGAGLISLVILHLSAQFTASSIGEAMIVVAFKPAFWLAVLAFATAATISFFRLRLWDKPSDNADFVDG